jgi:AcrR family transcriptional regulator
MDGADRPDAPERAGYRRSTGSPRGEARRRELLDRVTDDLAANGLVDFSLRRAARAAGTTHKVLLYHFASADDLLVQAILRLRDRRIEKGMAAAGQGLGEQKLSERIRAIWPILIRDEGQVLDHAIGLAMYDCACRVDGTTWAGILPGGFQWSSQRCWWMAVSWSLGGSYS